MTGKRYAGLSYSGHAFTAPPGTTITRVRLRGRFARGNCAWGTIVIARPSRSTLLGLPNGRSYACFAETAILALTGHSGHFSLGNPTLDQVDEIRRTQDGADG